LDLRVVDVDYAWWFPEEDPAREFGWQPANVNILTGDATSFNQELGFSNLCGSCCRAYKTGD
jgi:hypothetical protein